MAGHLESHGQWWEVASKELEGDTEERGTPEFVASPQLSSEDDTTDLSQACASSPGSVDDHFITHSDSIYQDLAQWGTEGENYVILTPSTSNKAIVVSLIVSSHLRRRGGRGRVVLLSDTYDSAEKEAKQLQESLPQSKVRLCTPVEGAGEATVHGDLTDCEVVVCTPEKLLDSLQEKRMTFDDITLFMVDKFHHAQRSPQYTEVLQSYLAQKHKDGDLTISQVVGVASIKEAASCFKPEVESTMRQLLSLCAIMDATNGIKISTRPYLDPVERPVFSFEISYQRDKNEPLIRRVSLEMSKLEQMVDLRCPFKKWSLEYDSLLDQNREYLTTSANIEDRNKLTVLDMLEYYSKALRVYMDARFDDAFTVLLTHSFTDPADRLQEQLAQGLEEVKADIGALPKTNNPILTKLEDILLQEFLENPDLTAVLIAHNEQQASSLKSWLSKLPEVDELDISPYLFTLPDRFEQDSEIKEAIAEGVEIFEHGAYNVLVTTPDIAELAELQQCSVIIRLQSVSNELATKLLRDSPLYKPPSRDSIGFSVLSSHTKSSFDAMLQEESEGSLRQAIKQLPARKLLREQVLDKQKKIVRVHGLRRQHSLTHGQKKRRPVSEIILEVKCKVCKSLAVRGSDIFMVEEGTQCVVPDRSKLSDRVSLKPHLPPMHMIGSLVETQRIHCANCSTEWGALCYWPLKGYEFHVLRCKSFLFEMNGSPHTVRRWSDAPFTIPPLSAHPDFPLDSSDSGTLSDEECSD